MTQMGRIVFILLFCPLTLISQDHEKIDSLILKSENTDNDSVKSFIYNTIAQEYWFDDPDGCAKYASMALFLAKKINSYVLITKAYQNLASAFSFNGDLSKSLQYNKQAYEASLKVGDDALTSSVIINWSDDLVLSSRFDSANSILDKGIELALKKRDRSLLAQLYLNKANAQYYLGNYEAAEEQYKMGLRQSASIGDSNIMMLFFNNIASVRLYRGVCDSVVVGYVLDAIRYNERKHRWNELGDNYSNMASVYNLRNNSSKAIYYLKLGYDVFIKSGSNLKAITLLVSLAEQYRNVNLLDSAGYYADLAILLGENSNYEHGLAAAYSVKGYILGLNSDYEKAELYLKRAYQQFLGNQDSEGILFSGNNLASVLKIRGNYNEAISIGNQVLQNADSIRNYSAMKTVLLILAESHHQLGNYSQAYDYIKSCLITSDTIEKLHNRKIAEDMAVKYETQKKDKELLIQEKKLLQQSRMIIIVVSFGILFFLLASLIFMYLRHKKSKFEWQLQKMSNNFLRSQLKPHFIHNALMSIGSFIHRNPALAEEYLNKYSILMRDVLEKSEEESIYLEDEFAILAKYLDLEALRIKNGFSYSFNIDGSVDAGSVKIPPLLLQPILENAVWHGISGRSDKGRISLNISRAEQTLHCSIENTCTGDIVAEGNQRKERRSYGLQICENRLKLLSKEKRSDWQLELIPIDHGMKVNLRIPL